MKRKTIWLDDCNIEYIDEVSSKIGLSSGEVIRELINKHAVEQLLKKYESNENNEVNDEIQISPIENVSEECEEELQSNETVLETNNVSTDISMITKYGTSENYDNLDELEDLDEDFNEEPSILNNDEDESIEDVVSEDIKKETQVIPSMPLNNTFNNNLSSKLNNNSPAGQIFEQPSIPIVSNDEKPSIPSEYLEEIERKKQEETQLEAIKEQERIQQEEEKLRQIKEKEERQRINSYKDKAIDFINQVLYDFDYDEDEDKYIIYTDSDEYQTYVELNPFFKYLDANIVQKFNSIVKIEEYKNINTIEPSDNDEDEDEDNYNSSYNDEVDTNEDYEDDDLDETFQNDDEDEDMEFNNDSYEKKNNYRKHEDEEPIQKIPYGKERDEDLTEKELRIKQKFIKWCRYILDNFSEDNKAIIYEDTDDYKQFMKYRNSSYAERFLGIGRLRMIDLHVEINPSFNDDEDLNNEDGDFNF